MQNRARSQMGLKTNIHILKSVEAEWREGVIGGPLQQEGPYDEDPQ